MNKLIILPLLASMLFFGFSSYNGSTVAPVILVGSIIKVKNTENNKKFKRKDCPVCKGTGKYLSGDKIKMVDCGYCEPEESKEEIVHPEIKLYGDSKSDECSNPNCRCKKCKCKNCGCVPSLEK